MWGKMSRFMGKKVNTWSKGSVDVISFLQFVSLDYIYVHYIDVMSLSFVLKALFLAGKHWGEHHCPLVFATKAL